MSAPAIQDYALIGNCRSAALVSRGGSIDWLCWPTFDSPSLFGALLDPKGGGQWSVRPRGPFRATRQYVDDTNVLETRFETATGTCVLWDWMPVADDGFKRSHAWPDNEILRLARCESGHVELEVTLDPKPRYGLKACRVRSRNGLGASFECDGALVNYRAECGSEVFQLSAGQERGFSLSYATVAPAVLLPLGGRVREELERSKAWWRQWAGRTRYTGPLRDAVVRSALALKLLTFAPSGAIIAAPTTSLPEQMGGALNWDYRYCWLRDASFTSRALFASGHPEEGSAYVSWMLNTTRLTWPRLRILYDLYGNAPAEEHVLRHWSGFGGSRPIRVGNAAAHQLQLDVYGEVVEATAQYVLRGGELDRDTRALLAKVGEYVCAHWMEPDEGIWETRHGRREHTFSRLMCWAALDRLLELESRFRLKHLPTERLRSARNALRRVIETRAWNPKLGAYVQSLDGEEVDASLLLMPWYGFTSARSERMQSTWRRIQERLGAGGGLLYRYAPARGESEGAFGICSFWGAEFLALGGGTPAEAEAAFRDVVSHANDVGLFAEQIDPVSSDALGNFPQAFTHIGLVNAALTLEQRLQAGDEEPAPISPRSPRTQEASP